MYINLYNPVRLPSNQTYVHRRSNLQQVKFGSKKETGISHAVYEPYVCKARYYETYEFPHLATGMYEI